MPVQTRLIHGSLSRAASESLRGDPNKAFDEPGNGPGFHGTTLALSESGTVIERITIMNSISSTDHTAPDVSEAVRQLNSFLRGEISAAETYRMAIDKLAESEKALAAANVGLLREIQEEHSRAAQTLRDRIQELGGETSDSSGAWGAWASTVQGTMNLFGDASALKSLKEGEEHGLKDYQAGVDDIDTTSQQVVQNQLIPAQQRHINVLDQLIGSVGRA